MTTFLTVLHVMVCIVIVVVVLLQRGKGAEIGAVFGGGASSTVFGSRGAGNFLTKITTGAAITFMLTSLALAYFAAGARQGERLFDPNAMEKPPAEAPAPEKKESPFGEFGDFGEAPAQTPSDAAKAPSEAAQAPSDTGAGGPSAPSQGKTPAP
jgi:preprotein translocase subunit SecG